MRPFGWSYPPGAASDPNAPYNQTDDGPCAVCCKPADTCICAECRYCGEQGNPACYIDGHHSDDVRLAGRMSLTREQAIGRAEAVVQVLKERLGEAEQSVDYLRGGGEFSDDLSDNPDPWR